MRASAISRCHWSSCSRRSCSSTNVRPGRKFPLRYFTPDSTFPLGLGAIGAAEMRLEPPVVGELLEGRIPDDPAVAAGLTDGPGPIVEVLAGVAAEVVEGAF